MTQATLAVLTSLPAKPAGGGKIIITRKFIEGMALYAEYWGGPVKVYFEPATQASTNLDETEVGPGDLPFEFELVSFTDAGFPAKLAAHKIVLAATSYKQNHLAMACRTRGVPLVYVAEYSLATRVQVVKSQTTNPLLRLRRSIWEYGQERKQRAAVRQAAGLQCNGTPTFEAYRKISASPLLYFDTRVTGEMLATEGEIDARRARLLSNAPLNLIFSGRLVAMKGADHLPKVAAELKRLSVPFAMTIFGGGPLEPVIRAEIARMNLGDSLKLGGLLDFKTELMPYTRQHADLFVCCHRSGDPSCTYLEVMSCGVPIVGYDNEAFLGITRESAVGWAEPMDQPRRVAARIAALAADRRALADAAPKAMEFGRKHTFDRTFRARIDHLKGLAKS